MKIQTINEMLAEIPFTALDIILSNDIYTLNKTICVINNVGNRCLLTDWNMDDETESFSYVRNCLMDKDDIKNIVIAGFKNFIKNNTGYVDRVVKKSNFDASLDIGAVRSAVINVILTKIKEDYWNESTLVTSLSRIFERIFKEEKDILIIPTYKEFLRNNPTNIEKNIFKMFVNEETSMFSIWHLYVDRTDMSAELKYVLWVLAIFKTWDKDHYVSQLNVRNAGKLTIFKNKIIELLEASNEI